MPAGDSPDGSFGSVAGVRDWARLIHVEMSASGQQRTRTPRGIRESDVVRALVEGPCLSRRMTGLPSTPSRTWR